MASTSQVPAPSALSSALEDYLETVFELAREGSGARVKDIAEARAVTPASVSVALKRLAGMGLVEHTGRDSLRLTPEGELAARRVSARHRVLMDFLHGVLGLPADTAARDACAMEHSLSDEGMNHLTQFLEHLQVCPQASDFLEHLRHCSPLQKHAGRDTRTLAPTEKAASTMPTRAVITLDRLPRLSAAKVQMVKGAGALRQRLLDLGLLPGARIQVLRAAPASGPLWIQLDGTQLSLRRQEAEVVLVEPALP